MSAQILLDLAMTIEVSNLDAFYAAAFKTATTQGRCPLTVSEATDLLRPGGVIDASACAQMLIDPGISPEGSEIIECCVEETSVLRD